MFLSLTRSLKLYLAILNICLNWSIRFFVPIAKFVPITYGVLNLFWIFIPYNYVALITSGMTNLQHGKIIILKKLKAGTKSIVHHTRGRKIFLIIFNFNLTEMKLNNPCLIHNTFSLWLLSWWLMNKVVCISGKSIMFISGKILS